MSLFYIQHALTTVKIEEKYTNIVLDYIPRPVSISIKTQVVFVINC